MIFRTTPKPDEESKAPTPTWYLLSIMLVVVAATLGHLVLLTIEPEPRLYGDEGLYIRLAELDLRQSNRSLLPGQLRFEHRPQLWSRVLSYMTTLGDRQATYRRATHFNTFFHILAALLIVRVSRLLGIGRAGALVAGIHMALFPWNAFFSHTLWPESLHSAMLAAFLWSVAKAQVDRRLRWWVLAGLSAGIAFLTKAVMSVFIALTLPFLLLGLPFGDTGGTSKPLRFRLLAAAALLTSVASIAGPQIHHNGKAGHGYSVAANRWWNLEVGITPDADKQWARRVARKVTQNYRAAADTPRERERLARERLKVVVQSRGVAATLGGQARKFVELILVTPSTFEFSIQRMRRWGVPSPAWSYLLAAAGRVWWYFLLVSAAFGLLASIRKPALWQTAIFLLGFSCALAFVPLKLRFAVPLYPLLAIFSAAFLDTLGTHYSQGSTGTEVPEIDAGYELGDSRST